MAAAILLGIKLSQLSSSKYFEKLIRDEIWNRRDDYLDQLEKQVATLSMKLAGIKYQVRDVTDLPGSSVRSEGFALRDPAQRPKATPQWSALLWQLRVGLVDGQIVGTIAASLAACAAGASLFRVHDVAEHVAALRVFQAIQRPPK